MQRENHEEKIAFPALFWYTISIEKEERSPAMFGRRKLFGERIQPACEYCRNGQYSQDHRMILCRHKGIVAPYFSCRKFEYEPTRRIPKRMRRLPQYQPEDFEL